MLNFIRQAIYDTYIWLARKLRSTALALFNQEYANSKRIEDIIKDTKFDFDAYASSKIKDIIDVNLNDRQRVDKYELCLKQQNFQKSLNLNDRQRIDKYELCLKQKQNFQKSLENVILFKINRGFIGRYGLDSNSVWHPLGFSYNYDGRDPIFYVLSQASEVESITRGNRDLVLLLLLIFDIHVDSHRRLLTDLIKSHSGSRVEMIEKIHLLQEEGKLSINSRKHLDCMIKMSTFIEKQCSSNEKSIMDMVSSGNVDGLVQDVEKRVKELTKINITYDQDSPAKSLKDHSIDALVKHDLLK